VVVDTSVPKRIRSGINIESGLNDGIVFPLLITALLLISSHQALGSDNSWVFFGSFTEVLQEEQSSFLESEGEVLILISFLVFGLTFIPLTIEQWSLKVFLYAFLSLTLFRMLPVFISLVGLGLSNTSKLFIGWFGPRGIASILYVMTVAHSVELSIVDEELFAVISVTILLSIILHGLSATPLVKKYGSRLD